MIAAQLRVMAEPNRIRLLEMLNQGDATVQELSDQLATTHQNVSKHLGILFQAGMVKRRSEGPSVRYSLIDWTGWWVIEQIGQAVTVRLEELGERLRGE
jgi:DNA-binding transcriptional ArsR family regulator